MSCANPFENFHELVGRGLSPGWQAYVSRDGAETVYAAGGVDALRRPITTESQFSVYCAGKPLLGLLACVAVDQETMRFDTHVHDVLRADMAAAHQVSIAELLEHRSGIFQPGAIDSAFVTVGCLAEAAACAPRAKPSLGRNESMYSEAAAWAVLGAVVARFAKTGHSSAKPPSVWVG